MAKFATDAVLDASLLEIADNGDRMFLCSQFPSNYTEASSTFKLAAQNLTKGIAGADYAITDSPTSGRLLTITAQSGVTIDDTGTATHIAICDSVGTVRLKVFEIANLLLTAGGGNTVNTDALEYTNSDPA